MCILITSQGILFTFESEDNSGNAFYTYKQVQCYEDTSTHNLCTPVACNYVSATAFDRRVDVPSKTCAIFSD